MPIKHSNGVISLKKDCFYYSGKYRCWSRLLIRGGKEQGYLKEVAISLTPANGFGKEGGVFFIKNEYIRYYSRPKKHPDDIYTSVLPKAVFNEMCERIGIPKTIRLIDHDYIFEIDFDKMLASPVALQFKDIKREKPFKGRVKALLENYPILYKSTTLGKKDEEETK